MIIHGWSEQEDAFLADILLIERLWRESVRTLQGMGLDLFRLVVVCGTHGEQWELSVQKSGSMRCPVCQTYLAVVQSSS